MGLINFWGQKSTLDQLDKDLSNLKLYVTHVSGCIAEIDACWIGNKDKEKVVSAISLHLHIVNKSNNDLNIFKQTATFILVKMNELGSLIGLSIPAIANMCFPGLFTEVRIYPRIQIDTAALRTVADKIEGERKYLEETSFSIKNTKNIIDDIILNMNGLGKLLKDLDREVAEQKQENQKIVNGIRHICELYENAEKRLNEKISALGGLGTTSTPDIPASKTPRPSQSTDETNRGVREIRKIVQNNWETGYDTALWGEFAKDSSSGCAVASTSMALSSLGIYVTPRQICYENSQHNDPAKFLSTYMYSWDQFKNREDGQNCVWHNMSTIGSSDDITNAIKNYKEHPDKYSPPILGVENNASNPGADHYVVCVDINPDGSFLTQDPGSLAPSTYNGIYYSVYQYEKV